MTTSSVLNKEQQELVEPDENLMFDRENRGMRQLRYELSEVTPIEADTKYIRKGDATFVHPDSDVPLQVTAEGETAGSVDIVKETGATDKLFRTTSGFNLYLEDENVDEHEVQSQRDAVMKLLDYMADSAFFGGVSDRNGNTLREGVFSWLDSNMDSGNIINANDYDVTTDLNGIPANIVKRVAYEQTSGEYVDTQWDVAVAKHPVWARLNEIDNNSGATQEDHWTTVQADRDDASVGVNRPLLLPEQIKLRSPPGMSREISTDIDFPARTNSGYSSPLSTASDDALYLIPDHGGDFWQLFEMGSPDARTLAKEGFKERVEYMWRYGHVFDHSMRVDGTPHDVIKIENITSLF